MMLWMIAGVVAPDAGQTPSMRALAGWRTCLVSVVRDAMAQERVPEEMPALLDEACPEQKLAFLEEEGRLEVLEPLSATEQINKVMADYLTRYALWHSTGRWSPR